MSGRNFFWGIILFLNLIELIMIDVKNIISLFDILDIMDYVCVFLFIRIKVGYCIRFFDLWFGFRKLEVISFKIYIN